MARYIEVTARDGTVSRTRIDPSVNRFSVRPGDAFRIVDDSGNVPPGIVVKRYDNHLFISGVDEPGQATSTQVELLDFYGVCSVATPCQVEVKEASGTAAPVLVTSSSEPVAALADGSFVLYDASRGTGLGPEPTAATSADAEGSSPNTALIWGGVGVGIAALALAGGGGGGGDDGPSAVSPSPTEPTPGPTPGPAPTPAPPPPAGTPADTTPPSRPSIATISSDGRVTLAEKAAGLTVVGTGEAGATVSVSIDGAVQSGAVDGAGNWQVRFTPAQVGGDGAHTAVATVTDVAGNRSAAASASYTVTTLASIFAVDADGVINGTERANGFTVVGGGPEGSPAGTAITVALAAVAGAGSASRTVATGANGNWSATFGPGDNLVDGNYTVSASGAVGDVTGAAATRTALIDGTPPQPPTIAPVTGDNIVTAAEAVAGVVVTGRSEAGSTVSVSINGTPLAVSTAGDGSWSAPVPAQLLQGAGARGITASATDAAGNRGADDTQLFIVTSGLNSVDGIGDTLGLTKSLQLDQLVSGDGVATPAIAPSTASFGGPDPTASLAALIDDPNRGSLA